MERKSITNDAFLFPLQCNQTIRDAMDNGKMKIANIFNKKYISDIGDHSFDFILMLHKQLI